MGTVIDSHFLVLTAIVTVGYQFFFFVITALLKFDKVTDFAGSTNFIILAVLTFVLKASWLFRQVVLTLLVVIWGIRLALFLLLRILHWGEDRRFDEMRNNLGKLAIFWIFQAVWVWTVSLPVTVVNASDRDLSLQDADIIGWIMWAVGISVEATADQQKLSFKNSPENRGKWCTIGLWKYSRHPNYFGEVSLIKNCVQPYNICTAPYNGHRSQQTRSSVMWVHIGYTRKQLALLFHCHQRYTGTCPCGSKQLYSLNFLSTVVTFHKKSQTEQARKRAKTD